ncbi:hypothetical protein INR49_031906 [Caranx melampygus]|nr:hypothetical protein INR49_031906 [Caranx melampygus]
MAADHSRGGAPPSRSSRLTVMGDLRIKGNRQTRQLLPSLPSTTATTAWLGTSNNVKANIQLHNLLYKYILKPRPSAAPVPPGAAELNTATRGTARAAIVLEAPIPLLTGIAGSSETDTQPRHGVSLATEQGLSPWAALVARSRLSPKI